MENSGLIFSLIIILGGFVMVRKTILLLLLFVTLFLLVGCSNVTKIRFNVESGFYTNDFENHPSLTKLVKSRDELQLVCDEYELINESPKYNEDYFKERAIILLSFSDKSIAITHQIECVIKDGKLIVNLICIVPSGNLPTAVKHCSYLIEVEQGDVEEISDVRVNRSEKTK